jgi:hypothetical protein
MDDFLLQESGDYLLQETGDKILLEQQVEIPTVVTLAASGIGQNSALGNGNITSTGGENPSIRGFQYNTVPAEDKTVQETASFSTGAYQLSLLGLTPGQTYFFRAFATNSEGTGYGEWLSFTATASQYAITIDGIDRTGDIVNQTLTIQDILNDQQNTCTFVLVNLSGNGIPETDDEITIDLPDGTRIFGGRIIGITLSSKRETGVVFATIQCVDYVRDLDHNLVSKAYTDMTDKEIIEDIVATFAPGLGITTNNVIEGVTIDQINFNYVQPSQALRRIADLTGRNWYIDYNKDIHYFPLLTNTTPFNITDVAEPVRTTYINDSMATLPAGTLKNDAAYVSPSYVMLNPASSFTEGHLEYEKALASSFVAEFDFRVINATDGDSTFFYWGAQTTPLQEDEAAGYGGYLVAFDEFVDQIQLWFDGTLLTSVSQTLLDDGNLKEAKVVVVGSNIKVYLGGVLKIDYTDSVRSLLGTRVGVGGRSGLNYNEHRLFRFFVYNDSLDTNATDYADLTISKDASQLKNRVYVRGGTNLSDLTTYEEKGDGVKRQFLVPDKPHDVTIRVNGVEKTLGIKNVDTSGFQWYVNFQEKYVEQDASEAILGTGDTLEVEYRYDIPILVAVEDTASIAENGQREFPIFDKTITTQEAARARAAAELTDYANDLIEGSFTTHTAGFRAGQYIRINLDEYEVDADYIVQRVTAISLGGGKYQYDIAIASAKTMGIIRFLIELLEANNKLIEVNDDEVVDNLLAVTDSLLSDSLTDNLTIDSAGPYATWCTDSLDVAPSTRARWDLFQWG